MKHINLLFCPLFFFIAAQAQDREPVNTKTDRRDFKGYVIKLLQAASGTYGYDVMKGTERVLHQSRNPFTASPRGLATKEDAYKLAQWQITQLRSRPGRSTTHTCGADEKRRFPAAAQQIGAHERSVMLSNGRVSPNVARQLQITITD